MAILKEMTAAELVDWNLWVDDLPAEMREGVRAKPPWLLYRHAATGQRVTICSYAEDGTVTMAVGGEYNLVSFERNVFGVPITALEECDLPGSDEDTGVLLKTREEIDVYIREQRERMFGKSH